MFDPRIWAVVPPHFWSLVFFTFGCLVGSFLNVCIHRMPRGLSVVSPPSHCPHCQYSIPWYLNIPLVTWLYLRGQCANCRASISPRYFLVELLTGAAFLAAWLVHGPASTGLALVYCLVLAGFIVATFIDFEHLIIPDEITLGGIVVGFVCSFLVPALHGVKEPARTLQASFWGIIVGGGVIYGVLRVGKLLFGKQKVNLPPDSRIVFTETALVLPDGEISYEEFFYRKTDAVTFEAKTAELVDRCYRNVSVRLSAGQLTIGDETFDPEKISHLEAVTDKLVLPREAMGFGDVKYMAAIGAFLGWPATVFSLMVSSVVGATVGVALIALRRQEWSSRLPYGPYITVAAVLWIFAGKEWWAKFWLGL